MNAWDFFNSAAGAASILGAILGLVAWINTRATNHLIAAGRDQTQAILREMETRNTAMLGHMDTRAAERHSDTLAVLDRMDQRAAERHREGEV